MHAPTYVYAPLQNIAIWLGAWRFGHVAFDACDESLTALGGPHRLEDAESEGSLALLTALRSQIPADADGTRLLLGAPGQPLPKGVEGHEALVLGQRGPHAILAFPVSGGGSGTQWRLEPAELSPGFMQPPLPGDADRGLREATEHAALLVERDGVRLDRGAQATLTVGSLTDFYENPGLPPCLPSRAAKLIARADRVAAIMETVAVVRGAHEFDPVLLPIGRAVREARMAAVAYCFAAWGRRIG